MKKNCFNCHYCEYDQQGRAHVCVNPYCRYTGDYVNDTMTCFGWVRREGDKLEEE